VNRRYIDEMNRSHELFCQEIVANNFNATQAYRVAYPDSSEEAARRSASQLLLTNRDVQKRIEELMAERSERLNLKADDVLRLLWMKATADPNELVEVRRDCCRHCYGLDHLYQFTPAEWGDVVRKHQDACRHAEAMRSPLPPEPSPLGGVGYDPRFPPLPDCPECAGRGVEYVHVKDTRTLSPAARQLYAGARQSRTGIEILSHSQDKAIELIGRHLAMFTDKVDHTNNGGSFQPMTLSEFYSGPVKPDPEPSSS
jgi:phage terminase small subunit